MPKLLVLRIIQWSVLECRRDDIGFEPTFKNKSIWDWYGLKPTFMKDYIDIKMGCEPALKISLRSLWIWVQTHVHCKCMMIYWVLNSRFKVEYKWW